MSKQSDGNEPRRRRRRRSMPIGTLWANIHMLPGREGEEEERTCTGRCTMSEQSDEFQGHT